MPAGGLMGRHMGMMCRKGKVRAAPDVPKRRWRYAGRSIRLMRERRAAA